MSTGPPGWPCNVRSRTATVRGVATTANAAERAELERALATSCLRECRAALTSPRRPRGWGAGGSPRDGTGTS